jgi:general secretion pathway protein F
MGQFAYIARDPAGRRVTGRLACASQQAALAELSSRALAPVRVEALSERPPLLRRGVSTRRLAGAYRQLADLLRSGVPLLRGLRLLGRNKSNARLARVMNEIAEQVADGARLADAMASKPDVFPDVHVAMVRAGEAGGFLESVLARLGAFLEHQADMRSRVVGNLIYPAILLSVAGVVIVGALVGFVPKFRPMFSRIDVPWATELLLATSDIVREQWIWLLVGVVGVIGLVTWLGRDAAIRRRAAEFQLRVPALGPFIKSLCVARFARILGTMLGNGIPMLAAMKISRDAAGHVVLAEAIDKAAEAVRAGESLAKPLADSGVIGEDVVEMIAVGEQANNLPDVLVTIAETIEKRVDRMLAVLLRLMEPLLLLVLAGVVVFIFVALFLPMLRMSAAIGQ